MMRNHNKQLWQYAPQVVHSGKKEWMQVWLPPQGTWPIEDQIHLRELSVRSWREENDSMTWLLVEMSILKARRSQESMKVERGFKELKSASNSRLKCEAPKTRLAVADWRLMGVYHVNTLGHVVTRYSFHFNLLHA